MKKYDYVKIRTQRLQGLVLNAFCLRKHITHLRFIEAQYTRTGFGGMWVREYFNYINLFVISQIRNVFFIGQQRCSQYKTEHIWNQYVYCKYTLDAS